TKLGRIIASWAPRLQNFYCENFDIDILGSSPDGSIPIRLDFHRFNKAIGKAVSQTSLKNAFDLLFTATDSQERFLAACDYYPMSIRGDTNPEHATFLCLITRANTSEDLIP